MTLARYPQTDGLLLNNRKHDMSKISDYLVGLEDEGKAPHQLDPLHQDNQGPGVIPGTEIEEGEVIVWREIHETPF